MIRCLPGNRFAILLLLLGSILTSPLPAVTQSSANSPTLLLSGSGWKLGSFAMSQGEKRRAYLPAFDDRNFRDVAVPGEVQLQVGLSGMNLYRQSRTLTLINSKEWWYRKHFTVSGRDKGKLNRLIFGGVDYFATVWLNGKKLGEHEGAYVPFSYNVSDKLNFGGDNVLAVKVTCPWYPDHRGLLAYMKGNWVEGSPGEQIHIDKPPFFLSAFWDGIPNDGNTTLPMGLTRDVKLVTSGWSVVKDLFVRTRSLNADGSATLEISGTVKNYRDRDVTLPLKLKMAPDNFTGQSIVLPPQTLTLHPGNNRFSVETTIAKPHLWWTWDTGKPNLYRLTASLPAGAGANGSVVFGIRTIVVKKDMSYWLNGRRLFLKGAWYPMSDYYGSRPTRETFLKDLELVKGANLNHLVAFSVVEKPEFYDLCDRMGILLIFELPFPQSGPVDVLSFSNPRRPAYVKESLSQVRQIVTDLRNHPSIVEWAAFAEVHAKGTRDLNKGWGLGDWDFDPYGYVKFSSAIGREVESVDPGTIYHPSLCDFGEQHFWEGNAGMIPESGSYLDLFHAKADLISEYGSLSLPNIESLKQELSPSDMWSQQNASLPRWNNLPINIGAYSYLSSYTYDGFASVLDRVNEYVDRHIRSAQDLVEDSQLYQGFLMKYATEAFRRKKGDPVNGVRFWDFGEAWPGIRWGIVDFYRRPKLSYYFVKRAEARFSLSFAYKDALESQVSDSRLRVPVWIVSDYPSEEAAAVHCQIADTSGRVAWSGDFSGTVPANGKLQMGEIDWTAPATPGVYALTGTATAKPGGLQSRDRTFFKVTPRLFARPLHLLLIGESKQGIPIAQMARALGVQVDTIDQNSLADLTNLEDATELRKKYDVIWLGPFENAWRLLKPREVAGLQAAIRSGVGFIHSGGRASFHGGFGVGAALDLTGLDQVLPVELSHRYDLLLGQPNLRSPAVYTPIKDIRTGRDASAAWPDVDLRKYGLAGFNRTQLKPGSREILTADGEPLLVTGIYGRGRVVAFTGFTPALPDKDRAWVVDEHLYRDPASQAYFQIFAEMLAAASGEKADASPAAILASREEPLFEMLKDLPAAQIKLPATVEGDISSGQGRFSVRLENGTNYARLIRLRVKWRPGSGSQDLVLFSDNDFDLSPGQARTITASVFLSRPDVHSLSGRLMLDGENLAVSSTRLSLRATEN